MWATLTVEAQAVGDLRAPCRRSRPGSAHRRCVTTLIPLLDARAEHLLHLRQERAGVPELGCCGLAACAGSAWSARRASRRSARRSGCHEWSRVDHLLRRPRADRRRSPSSWRCEPVGCRSSVGALGLDAHQQLPGVELLAGSGRTPRPRCRPPARRPVLHLHRLDGHQRLARLHDIADGDQHPQHGTGHRRDQRSGTTGIVGRRESRRYDGTPYRPPSRWTRSPSSTGGRSRTQVDCRLRIERLAVDDDLDDPTGPVAAVMHHVLGTVEPNERISNGCDGLLRHPVGRPVSTVRAADCASATAIAAAAISVAPGRCGSAGRRSGRANRCRPTSSIVSSTPHQLDAAARGW